MKKQNKNLILKPLAAGFRGHEKYVSMTIQSILTLLVSLYFIDIFIGLFIYTYYSLILKINVFFLILVDVICNANISLNETTILCLTPSVLVLQ